jgi:Thiol-activated cytolysin
MLRAHRRCATIAALLAAATTGCGSSSGTPGSTASDTPVPTPPHGVSDAGPSVLVINGDVDGGTGTAGNVPVGPSQTVSATGPNGEAMTCTVQQYSLTSTPTQFVSADPTSDVLWPGSLVQGASLPSGVLNPVPAARAPGTITLALATGSGSQVTAPLSNPSLSSATQAMNDLLSSYAGSNGGTPAKFSYQSEAVYSSSQLAIEAGVSASGTGWSGSASLGFDQTQTENRYLLQFTQAYFTMAFDPPAGPSAVFAPSVTQADLAPYTGPGNPLVYVSSVTYGRIFYLLFQSTSSSTNLSAAVQAAYQGGAVNVDAGVNVSYENVLDNTTIEAYGIGGDAASAIAAVTQASTGKFDALSKFLTSGATFDPQNPGVPISYTVRNLADSSEVALVFNTQYTAKDCAPISGTSANLLQNAGAEADQSLPPESAQITPWQGQGDYTYQYCASGTDLCDGARGRYFFGGEENIDGQTKKTSGSMSQVVDLTPYQAAIQTGNAFYHFGGWLGGWAGQSDSTSVVVTFPDANQSSTSLNTPAPPANTTGQSFLSCVSFDGQPGGTAATGSIPPNATQAVVSVSFTWVDGDSNDATADDLWFQVSGPGISGAQPITCGSQQ